MKETKIFFANNNKLNKGYIKTINPKESDSNFYRKKFEHILPPIDIIEQYENIYPGTLSLLINMAEKEQIHRHKVDLKNLELYENLVKKSKIYALIFVIFTLITTVFLTIFSHFIYALILVIILCITSFLGSIFSSNKFTKKYYERK